MKQKLLRRTAILRERDFKKLRTQALAVGYHRANWQPITIENLKKDIAWRRLKGLEWEQSLFIGERERRFKYRIEPFSNIIADMGDTEVFARKYIEWLRVDKRLYNPNWDNWLWQFNDATIMIRYTSKQLWQPLGIATLEMDY